MITVIKDQSIPPYNRIQEEHPEYRDAINAVKSLPITGEIYTKGTCVETDFNLESVRSNLTRDTNIRLIVRKVGDKWRAWRRS